MYFALSTKPFKMHGLTLALVSSVALLGTATYGVSAQPIAEPLASQIAPLQALSADDDLEPEALAALKTMGEYLGSMQTFGLKSDFSVELILDNAQSVEVNGHADYVVSRPDRLAVHLVTDFGTRDFIYGGKALYVVAPAENVFGAVEVGPTIKEMLEAVAYHLDVELPMADLFDWGTGDAPSGNIFEGFLVGTSQLHGAATKHWAFRGLDKDFQVWIEEGDHPLLRKIIIQDKAQPGQPTFTADLNWDVDLVPDQAAFSYVPPPDATMVHFLGSDDPVAEATP